MASNSNLNNSRFISHTIHSCARREVTGVQMHEVDLLFECILIRDVQAALPSWFSRSDVPTTVNYIYNV